MNMTGRPGTERYTSRVFVGDKLSWTKTRDLEHLL